ncbi:response regulator [Roseomonas eburnea]|uniref:Response regulator n=1 Tax=Neoroseomonas eburnea TaxID=1346889 RepID=A0A9X9XD49_9PROT|nr:response regulator [Neoroseomonas eburnea]MBR0681635.1 response regulator [Neoroseomonas eburnea]
MCLTFEPAMQDTGSTSTHSVVLVVDDEPIVASELAAGLRDLGHEASHAVSAFAAMRILAARPEIGVLVTDIRMPGTDGITLARAAAEARGEAATLAVVLITGHATPEELALAMPDGTAELVRKPFRLRDIQAAIVRAQRRAAERRGMVHAAQG